MSPETFGRSLLRLFAKLSEESVRGLAYGTARRALEPAVLSSVVVHPPPTTCLLPEGWEPPRCPAVPPCPSVAVTVAPGAAAPLWLVVIVGLLCGALGLLLGRLSVQPANQRAVRRHVDLR